MLRCANVAQRAAPNRAGPHHPHRGNWAKHLEKRCSDGEADTLVLPLGKCMPGKQGHPNGNTRLQQ